jgi:PPOX class probable F420-dependent enzyme
MEGPLISTDDSTDASTDASTEDIGRVRAARVARLATVDPDGGPVLVPITFALIGDDHQLRLVTAVDHKPKTTRHLRRLDHIRARPGVSVLIDHYDDRDWDDLWWARLTGDARVVDAESVEGVEAIDALVAKYPQYRDVRPAGPVIEVTPTRWQWWSADPEENP